MQYNFLKIEKKWISKWRDSKIYQVKEAAGQQKYYVLDMFP